MLLIPPDHAINEVIILRVIYHKAAFFTSTVILGKRRHFRYSLRLEADRENRHPGRRVKRANPARTAFHPASIRSARRGRAKRRQKAESCRRFPVQQHIDRGIADSSTLSKNNADKISDAGCCHNAYSGLVLF